MEESIEAQVVSLAKKIQDAAAAKKCNATFDACLIAAGSLKRGDAIVSVEPVESAKAKK